MLVRVVLAIFALLIPLDSARSQAPSGEADPLVSGQIGALVLALPAYPGAGDR